MFKPPQVARKRIDSSSRDSRGTWISHLRHVGMKNVPLR